METQGRARPSPALFLETATAFERSAALNAAVELDLFTAIGDRAVSAAEAAAACGASERGARILCDFLTVWGFLRKDDGAYRLTPDSAAFLDRHSPTYLGAALEFLQARRAREGFWSLADAVRREQPADTAGFTSTADPVWPVFARTMMPIMIGPARRLAEVVEVDPDRPLRVLDIGAGHGMFGITLARRYPRAEVAALDWPEVLEVAEENARNEGVRERYTFLPGSAFETDLGAGYDLVLLTNLLVLFDRAADVRLLRRVHAALAEGGRALSVQFMPDEDRVSPPGPAAFALTMLALTPSGDAYTFGEMEAMFRAAGFSRSERRSLDPAPQSLAIAHR
ncbi:MAG: methyltransferase domain-containing protein [Chthonomonadales bacterium]|nr:methyltransferase domain-containing protein [Chthonomonadales bacterium]